MVLTPIHITEVNKDGSIESHNMCEKCGEAYMKNLETTEPLASESQNLDITHIKTPEELLDFLANIRAKKAPPCECGMSDEEFEKDGKFGCPNCYFHFKGKMDELVFPFHNANHHVGKKPKRAYIEAMMNDPVEKKKLLKLRLAKSLELEEYEKAAEIKKELDAIISEPLP